ncbi:MAG: carbohydrate kinase [Weeksellaceae bacterium]
MTTQERFAVNYGEVIVDMVAGDTGSLVEVETFLKRFGGAPANTAVGLGRLDVPVALIGKVGSDPFGIYMKQTLENNNVDTSGLVLTRRFPTTMSFVSLQEDGERDFLFAPGAHDRLRSEEVELPPNAKILHFGSLLQIRPEAQETTNKLLRQAAKRGVLTSYDPNIRETLWGDLGRARDTVLETAKHVSIMKVNETEAELLSGTNDIAEAAVRLFQPNMDTLFITLGPQGCYVMTKHGAIHVEVPISVTPVDTTGAGDAFNAGYLAGIYDSGRMYSDMSQADLIRYVKRAAVIGALATTEKGAISALPTREMLTQYGY